MFSRAVWSMVKKDLAISFRDPQMLAITIVVPALFVGIFALVVHVSSTVPIAVAQVDSGADADRFVEQVISMAGVDGAFFEVVTTDPEDANRRYETGSVGAVLEVPEGFSERIAAGDAQVVLRVVNNNSDATKNFELRIEHAVRAFAEERTGEGAGGELTVVEESARYDADPKISTYLGSALLMFTTVFAAMINTGSLVAREWEERTAKAVVLSPIGRAPLVVAKWITASLQTALGLLVTLGGLAWLLSYPVTDLGLVSLGAIVALLLYGSGFGALLGVTLRRSLPIVPLCVVVGITHLLLNGYESYVRGFAHGGAIEILWRSASWWPMAALTDAIRSDVADLGDPVTWSAFGWTLALAVLLTALATVRLNRELTFTQSQ